MPLSTPSHGTLIIAGIYGGLRLWCRSNDPYYNGSEDGSAPFLDALLTGWNMRDKKIASEPTITFVKKKQFNFVVSSSLIWTTPPTTSTIVFVVTIGG